jgi:trans-2,3-dihydro-3-hydroxyanthranilate isomerase
VRVRIFTTQEELPFAGHPTLGTASVLCRNFPGTVRNETVMLALNVGAGSGNDESGSLFGEMTQRDPEFGEELDAAEVARLTGLTRDDLGPGLPPQTVSTGTAFAVVPLRSLQSLACLNVKHDEAGPWLRARGARWFYVLAPTGGAAPAWRARMQFYGGEDPATGSAAGCAISYLVRSGAVGSDERVHMMQGVEMGRPSELFLCAHASSSRVSNVRVAGSTVPVAKGRLFLP